jgi:hypothetical protein
MDDNFRRDVEAALTPQRGSGLNCHFGSDAPGTRKCKDPNCKNGGQFHFAGYCATCAVKHNIPLLTVTSAAAEDEPTTPVDRGGC